MEFFATFVDGSNVSLTMKTSKLTDMDVEFTEGNPMEDNAIDKVIAAPPEEKPVSRNKDKNTLLNKPDKNKPAKGKTSGRKDEKRKKKYARLAIMQARLEEKHKAASEKLILKENFARDLRTLIGCAADIKLKPKNISALKKVLKEISRDIKKSGKIEKIREQILKTEKKIARLKEKTL